MDILNKAILKIALLSLVVLAGIQTAAAAGEELPPIAHETAAQKEARLAWWRDARFGMFIHWGPSSVRGVEISWARIGHPHDIKGPHQSIPAEEYDNLYKEFNPVKFDAEAWVKLAKEAGMKYLIFTAKHHDGFSMFHTKLRPEYSIAATPFERDVCKELADAAHKEGLGIGWYYSTRDWSHPDYLVGDNKKYNAFYQGQIRELLTNYGKIDFLWFDSAGGEWNQYTIPELFKMIYELQPGIIVNNRAANFLGKGAKGIPPNHKYAKGDFITPENRIGPFNTNQPWESCITTLSCNDSGGWSYRPEGRNRSFAEYLTALVNTVTGDGNLLLNFGPLPTGEFDPIQVENLEKMGKWMKQYGGSIYGTRGGPWVNGSWGGSTHKGNKVYLHVLHWPNDNGISLPPLKDKIESAKIMGGNKVDFKQTDQNVTVEIPKNQRQPTDTVVELTLARPVSEIHQPTKSYGKDSLWRSRKNRDEAKQVKAGLLKLE